MGNRIEVSTAIDRYNTSGEREIDAQDEVILWEVNEQGERTNCQSITVDRFLSDEFRRYGSRLERLAAVKDADWLTNENRMIETKPNPRPNLWNHMFLRDVLDFQAHKPVVAPVMPVSPSAGRSMIEGMMDYFGVRSSL
ncbi:MAG TPA: hypothetical protein VFX30_00720 [bacterium]|nr:hypothetical protein [bacterium]